MEVVDGGISKAFFSEYGGYSFPLLLIPKQGKKKLLTASVKKKKRRCVMLKHRQKGLTLTDCLLFKECIYMSFCFSIGLLTDIFLQLIVTYMIDY